MCNKFGLDFSFTSIMFFVCTKHKMADRQATKLASNKCVLFLCLLYSTRVPIHPV